MEENNNSKQIDYQFYNKNFIGQLLKVIGIIIVAIGVIGGTVIAGNSSETFNISIFIIFLSSGLFGGVLLVGIGELIQLIQNLIYQSKNK